MVHYSLKVGTEPRDTGGCSKVSIGDFGISESRKGYLWGPWTCRDSSALVCPPVPTHPGTLLGAPRLLQLQMGNGEWRYTVPWPSTPRGQQDCRFNLRMHAQGCQRSLVRRTKTHPDGSCEGSLSSSSSEFEGNCNCMKAARTLGRLCCF